MTISRDDYSGLHGELGHGVAINLREAREMANLTQEEAAARSGVGHKTISAIETGRRVGSLKLVHLERLCLAYGVDPGQILGDPEVRQATEREMDKRGFGDNIAVRILSLSPDRCERMRRSFLQLLEKAEQADKMAGTYCQVRPRRQ